MKQRCGSAESSSKTAGGRRGRVPGRSSALVLLREPGVQIKCLVVGWPGSRQPAFPLSSAAKHLQSINGLINSLQRPLNYSSGATERTIRAPPAHSASRSRLGSRAEPPGTQGLGGPQGPLPPQRRGRPCPLAQQDRSISKCRSLRVSASFHLGSSCLTLVPTLQHIPARLALSPEISIHPP